MKPFFPSFFAGALLLGMTMSACTKRGGLKWAQSRAPAIRVNQLGYLPGGAKWATVKSESTSPLPVQLVDGNEKVLWSGETIPHGHDEASGDPVHWVDFSEVKKPTESARLVSEGAQSFPFRIAADTYAQLPYHALKYFYHNRSGEPIVVPYVPDQTWSRPAGHLSDASARCWGPQECNYRLDVSGGWYDAGDHGKYVVNGGISAWTLLAMYERFNHLGQGVERFGDGSLKIPESGNGVPDLLDEARVEVEFLMKMQVPAGHPLAGMVHHKIHDHAWTPLAYEPPAENENRALHPPSTAATLNMAAVAAQASRIYRRYDQAFAAHCLQAAESAYAAAKQHPDKFAPQLDNKGGGPYDDTIVSDEFFWAAAELFITTGEGVYLEDVKSSEHFESFPTRLVHPDGSHDGDGVTASMTWQSTAALGWISLAMTPSLLPAEQTKRLRQGVISAGETYLDVLNGEGYRLPLGLGPSKKYPWGSNSFVLNNMVVLSLAYDFSHDPRFANGVVQGMDYILGRNPMLQSYVTGFGTVPLEQPHHRFWAQAMNPKFPPPPPGAVSGGPNSSLQDPKARASGLHKGLPPQKCFVDEIEAWSVNEITINWNAPLAWVAAFLDAWRGESKQQVRRQQSDASAGKRLRLRSPALVANHQAPPAQH